MKTTIAYFNRLANDGIGTILPLGGDCLGTETLTATGAAAAAPATAKFARIATDTALISNVLGIGTGTLHPANSVEFFKVAAGQIITFGAA